MLGCDFPSIHRSVHPSVGQSVSTCINPNFDPNVQDDFPRTIKATVIIIGISLHLGMTTQTAVSIFDLNLYFTIHRLCKFVLRNTAFIRILDIDLNLLVLYYI